MFLTTPLSTLPSARLPSVCFFFSAFSSSRSALRDSTMLPRFLFTLITRMRSSWPRSASRFLTGRTSICDPGRNARTPMSTARPPLIRSMTRPMTTLRSAYADVDREAALDPLDDAADDDLALGIGLLDLVPNLHLLGFFAREDDVSFPVFRALEQHVDDVAGLHRHFAVLVEELVDLNDAFGLVSDVDDHFRRSDLEYRSLDDLAFRDV